LLLAAAALVVIVALPSIKSKREEAFQEQTAKQLTDARLKISRVI
jgi:hypothetical protein